MNIDEMKNKTTLPTLPTNVVGLNVDLKQTLAVTHGTILPPNIQGLVRMLIFSGSKETVVMIADTPLDLRSEIHYKHQHFSK